MLTKRLVSPGAEKWLHEAHLVDPQGEYKEGMFSLMDYMGGDESVIRVATAGHGLRIFSELPDDKKFLEHLAAKGIMAPFRSVQLQFWMETPIETALTFVYDPRISVNEYSGRYSVMVDSSYLPSAENIASRLPSHSLEEAKIVHELLENQRKETYGRYLHLTGEGGLDLARELSRIILGTDNGTKFFWKVHLDTLASFVQTQRALLEPHSITRAYVEAVAEVAHDTAPLAWNALMMRKAKALDLKMPHDEQIVDPPLCPAVWAAWDTKRVVVPELEDILFLEQKYLDHGAFQVVDYLGDDGSPANAARASYGKGTRKIQQDRGLVRTLVRDLHTSPIEMTSLAFEAKTPLFVDPRQAARHRTLPQHQFMGYTPLGSYYFMPSREQLRYQDRLNRQGRGKEMDSSEAEDALHTLQSTFDAQEMLISSLRAYDVPEELIRSMKGVGFYTRGWRCGDGHNIAHFLGLRLDVHAQKEIRDYAALVADAYRRHTPSTYEAFVDYQQEGMRLSRMEVEDLGRRLDFSGVDSEDMDIFRPLGFVRKDASGKEVLTLDGQGYQNKLRRFKNGA